MIWHISVPIIMSMKSPNDRNEVSVWDHKLDHISLIAFYGFYDESIDMNHRILYAFNHLLMTIAIILRP